MPQRPNAHLIGSIAFSAMLLGLIALAIALAIGGSEPAVAIWSLVLVAYGEGAIQVGESHAEAAIDDSPQLARRVTAQRGWVRRILIGIIAVEALAVIALFMLSPGLQRLARDTLRGAANLVGLAGPSTAATPRP